MEILFFFNSNLETCYNFHNVSFKFFINATVIVKEFDLLQPAQISVFLSLFPWLKFYASLQSKEKNMQKKIEREASGCSWTSVQMQIVSVMVIDQVSDPEEFCEWLNNSVPVNQSETIVLMVLFVLNKIVC